MILIIKAAGPTSELYLYEDGKRVAEHSWESGRKLSTELLPAIEALLKKNQKTIQDVTAIIVFQGPGSFTSLRIGITTANAIGYGLNIPVIGADGEDWVEAGLAAVGSAKPGTIVLPEYGAEANITVQKK